MRMQDGPTVEVEISVEATPARVWELVGDLALMGEWSPEYQGGELARRRRRARCRGAFQGPQRARRAGVGKRVHGHRIGAGPERSPGQ